MNNILRSSAAGLLAAITLPVAAGTLVDDYRQVYAHGTASHQVDIDNDSLLLTQRDGFYTSGVRYAYRRSTASASEVRVAGWRLGQELYTPSNINLPPALVGPPDRPYAGWLYGGVFHEVYRADGTHVRYGLDLGCLGPCAGGEWTQTRLHRLLDQPEPRGWARQVRNEAGVQLYAETAPVRWQLGRQLDATPVLRGRLGNIFTDAGAGITVRAGRLDALPGQRTLHAFLRADANLVVYNATMQGGLFSRNDPHTVDPKRVYGEVELGAAWRDGPFGLRVGVVHRTNEVHGLPNSVGAQNYLRLQLLYAP
ncbi:MAG TPA: lipid A deacylase LpxR family protein [Noviherbaspirillum sp.]|nr:lipid A deacylase LpxR family protein [Noviherbaspirillum sp.]